MNITVYDSCLNLFLEPTSVANEQVLTPDRHSTSNTSDVQNHTALDMHWSVLRADKYWGPNHKFYSYNLT